MRFFKDDKIKVKNYTFNGPGEVLRDCHNREKKCLVWFRNHRFDKWVPVEYVWLTVASERRLAQIEQDEHESKPFTEDEFFSDDETFEETGRVTHEVLDTEGGKFQAAGVVDLRRTATVKRVFQLDELSESDRRFIKVGTIVDEICGRRTSLSGAITGITFHVIKSWPKEEKK